MNAVETDSHRSDVCFPPLRPVIQQELCQVGFEVLVVVLDMPLSAMLSRLTTCLREVYVVGVWE